jgi:hypothetical protein
MLCVGWGAWRSLGFEGKSGLPIICKREKRERVKWRRDWKVRLRIPVELQ